MTPRTYSLAEAGEQICGDSMKRPEVFVYRRIHDGTFRAIRVGRKLRMTEQQIADALAALEVGKPPTPEPVRRLGITPASLKRRAS